VVIRGERFRGCFVWMSWRSGWVTGRLCRSTILVPGRQGGGRGLHYQLPPAAEMKMVRCIRGRVWDVTVDLRKNSPTFLQWHAEALTPVNRRMMVIPEGCAHGFQVLEADSELLYLHTAAYAPHLERGLRYDDPRLSISWPLDVGDISRRDMAHAWLDDNFAGVQL